MSTREDIWAVRLHDAVDEHPGAFAFDAATYVAAGRARVRRRRMAAVAATIASVAVVAALVAVVTNGIRGQALQPATPDVSTSSPAGDPNPNGWVALDGAESGGDIYLVRPGDEAHRVQVSGSDATSEACPAWSPDGTRLIFGRYQGSWERPEGGAELVIVPVDGDGRIGAPTVIGLAGFGKLPGFDAHPCATWAPDGRWVALIGAGEVWVVDTQTETIRRLPGQRPSDLEWRPGTDELTIAGDWGATRAAPTLSTPITIYSVATGRMRQLGAARAAHITWSPDGTTLAFTGGETDVAELRLIDADGRNERVLSRIGNANHGDGPAWSPVGDLIAYQRLIPGRGEAHVVALVDVADGSETIIEPPTTKGAEGRLWYPDVSWWSPDGTTLLYSGWSEDEGGPGGLEGRGVITVPVGKPSTAKLLSPIRPFPYGGSGVANQMWGPRPG